MNHSKKPGMSFSLGTNHLHGVLRVDAIRVDTLVQLVQHWAEPESRNDIIAALDELADVVTSPRREGALDTALEQVEDAAAMDTAQIEVGGHDTRRLLEELTAVASRTGRFNPEQVPSQREENAA
ncbi:hypothetical protein [Streptomyces sp. NPDC085596]|uniref:hypothetical protein n=1 Tax=Streptomyces sp. NPDC085596 TaxID=3365731 RepID=UPI0037D87B2B